jgi:hypothetical protein
MSDQTNILMETGLSLSTLVVKGTVSAVAKKIQVLKTEKDLESVRNKYDEIINEILNEREEAVRIAQLYKSEVDRIEISDKDIEHLNNTIGQILTIVQELTPTLDIDTFSKLQSLINVDTLKAMQLLGFNFKAAIGEPLTTLCSNALLSLQKKDNNNLRSRK